MRIYRSISFFLLVLWVIPSGLGFMMLKFQKRLIRNSVKELIYSGLSNSELSRIVFHTCDSDNLLWHHHDEFEFQGNMYDVISRDSLKDSIIYMCFLDVKESKVNITIDQLAKNIWSNSPLSNDFETKLVDFIQKVFPPQHFIEIPTCVLVAKHLYSDTIPSLSEGIKVVFLPPPEYSLYSSV